MQHDRIITRRLSLRRLLAAFDQHTDVRYVCLQTRQTLGHQTRVTCRANGNHVIFPPPRPLGSGEALLPLAFWYDSHHVCLVEHYREFVFQESLRESAGIVDVDGSKTRLKVNHQACKPSISLAGLFAFSH